MRPDNLPIFYIQNLMTKHALYTIRIFLHSDKYFRSQAAILNSNEKHYYFVNSSSLIFAQWMNFQANAKRNVKMKEPLNQLLDNFHKQFQTIYPKVQQKYLQLNVMFLFIRTIVQYYIIGLIFIKKYYTSIHMAKLITYCLSIPLEATASNPIQINATYSNIQYEIRYIDKSPQHMNQQQAYATPVQNMPTKQHKQKQNQGKTKLGSRIASCEISEQKYHDREQYALMSKSWSQSAQNSK